MGRYTPVSADDTEENQCKRVRVREPGEEVCLCTTYRESRALSAIETILPVADQDDPVDRCAGPTEETPTAKKGLGLGSESRSLLGSMQILSAASRTETTHGVAAPSPVTREASGTA